MIGKLLELYPNLQMQVRANGGYADALIPGVAWIEAKLSVVPEAFQQLLRYSAGSGIDKLIIMTKFYRHDLGLPPHTLFHDLSQIPLLLPGFSIYIESRFDR